MSGGVAFADASRSGVTDGVGGHPPMPATESSSSLAMKDGTYQSANGVVVIYRQNAYCGPLVH